MSVYSKWTVVVYGNGNQLHEENQPHIDEMQGSNSLLVPIPSYPIPSPTLPISTLPPIKDKSMTDPKADIARSAIDLFRENVRANGHVPSARDNATFDASRSRAGQEIGTRDSFNIATEAVSAYQRRSRDLPHDQAKEAAVGDVLAPRDQRTLDVKSFVRSVIDDAHANPGSSYRVIYAHASSAADDGRSRESDATKLASASLRRHEELTSKGMSHPAAREQVSHEMSERFDGRGRDTQPKSRDRSVSLGM